MLFYPLLAEMSIKVNSFYQMMQSRKKKNNVCNLEFILRVFMS